MTSPLAILYVSLIGMCNATRPRLSSDYDVCGEPGLPGVRAKPTRLRWREDSESLCSLTGGSPTSFSASCRSLLVATQPCGPVELMYQAMAEVIY